VFIAYRYTDHDALGKIQIVCEEIELSLCMYMWELQMLEVGICEGVSCLAQACKRADQEVSGYKKISPDHLQPTSDSK